MISGYVRPKSQPETNSASARQDFPPFLKGSGTRASFPRCHSKTSQTHVQTDKNPARDVRSAGCLYLALLILPLSGVIFPDSMSSQAGQSIFHPIHFLLGQRDTPRRERKASATPPRVLRCPFMGRFQPPLRRLIDGLRRSRAALARSQIRQRNRVPSYGSRRTKWNAEPSFPRAQPRTSEACRPSGNRHILNVQRHECSCTRKAKSVQIDRQNRHTMSAHSEVKKQHPACMGLPADRHTERCSRVSLPASDERENRHKITWSFASPMQADVQFFGPQSGRFLAKA